MSCFGGKMDLYSFISIDRYDKDNLTSSTYFLSHCHTDHMVGLDSPDFATRLRTNDNMRLYVCEVTKILLLADPKYAHLKAHITVLPIEEPKIINISVGCETHEVTVTLLSAGHCPGSVMFLFEGGEGTCLYTGDFRLPKGSVKRIKHLHSGIGKKVIDHLYVDTTFCIPDANYIPEREMCLESLVSIVEGWISKGKSHVVRLNLSAKYGYEYLYQALYEKFKTKIYCARVQYYRCLPDIAKILTANPMHSQIYACFKKEKVSTKDWSQWKSTDEESSFASDVKILSVTLSTLYFTHVALPDEVNIKTSETSYRLCFSFHSSLSEVCDFVRYIKPKKVHANVIPRSGETFKTVEDRLIKLCGLRSNGVTADENDQPQYTPIGMLSTLDVAHDSKLGKQKTVMSCVFDGDDSDEELNFSSFKRKKLK